jgi:hypothetical protein
LAVPLSRNLAEAKAQAARRRRTASRASIFAENLRFVASGLKKIAPQGQVDAARG